MISIFDDLIRNKEIKKIDIVDYIEFYKEKYLELNKKYEYYYDIYDTINNIQIKEKLDEEIKQYQTEDPKFFDFKKETPIDTLFMKSCLLESLQLVINEKSRKDKDLKVSIKKNFVIIAALEPRLLDYRCCPFQILSLPSPWPR